MVPDSERWNHNIHFHPWVLSTVPRSARSALDAGCGEGMLTRRLRAVVPHVVGVDLDAASIALARTSSPPDIEFRLADVLDAGLEPASFDVVASVATLHHIDAVAGLTALRGLLRPGGVLAIVGCARSAVPRDVPFELVSASMHRILRRGRTVWEHPSPVVWPPPVTYSAMRRIAASVLPGSHFRRRPPWRYTLTWQAPPA